MHFIAGLLCAILLWQAAPARAAGGVADDATPAVPAAWLIKKISVAEAETDHPGINDERVQRFPDIARPFGFQNGEWEALKAQMQPGDEIWTFASPRIPGSTTLAAQGWRSCGRAPPSKPSLR
jgi:hypothetical protein